MKTFLYILNLPNSLQFFFFFLLNWRLEFMHSELSYHIGKHLPPSLVCHIHLHSLFSFKFGRTDTMLRRNSRESRELKLKFYCLIPPSSLLNSTLDSLKNKRKEKSNLIYDLYRNFGLLTKKDSKDLSIIL